MRVAPKLPIGHVLFLLSHAAKPVAWGEEVIGTHEVPEFVTAVAEAYARLAETAIRRG